MESIIMNSDELDFWSYQATDLDLNEDARSTQPETEISSMRKGHLVNLCTVHSKLGRSISKL